MPTQTPTPTRKAHPTQTGYKANPKHAINRNKAKQYLMRAVPLAVRNSNPQIAQAIAGFKLRYLVQAGLITTVQATYVRNLIKVCAKPKKPKLKLHSKVKNLQKVVVTSQQQQWLVGMAQYTLVPTTQQGYIIGNGQGTNAKAQGLVQVYLPANGSTPAQHILAATSSNGVPQQYTITAWLP